MPVFYLFVGWFWDTHCINRLVTLILNMNQETINQSIPYMLYHLMCIDDQKPVIESEMDKVFMGSGLIDIEKLH